MSKDNFGSKCKPICFRESALLLLSFFYWIRVEEPIFHSKANLFFPVEIHLDPVAVYFMRNSLVSHFVESF